MEKNKMKERLILGLIFLIIFFISLLLLFIFRNDYYTVSFNTDGGNSIKDIKVKENNSLELPENPSKDGYTFIGWINSKGELISNNSKFDENITLKALWRDNSKESVTLTFDSGYSITIEKDSNYILPISPSKKGYTFIGWLDENNNLVYTTSKVNKDTKLKAYYIKNDISTITIKVDTDGGENINSYKVEKDGTIILPVNPTKKGYVFSHWVLSNGDEIKSNMKVTSNMTIKAIWKTPYTCESGCTPIEDGSKCTKEVTTKKISSYTCSEGKLVNKNRCTTGSKYPAINTDSAPFWVCNNSTDYQYDEEEAGGAISYCQPTKEATKEDKCPSGYTLENDTCKKTETIKCKAN